MPLVLGTLLAWSVTAVALHPAQLQVFRIGTGGPHGTYFPIGSLIARGLNEAFVGCDVSPDCTLPPVIGLAQLSSGSAANVAALQRGDIEAALVQADVAFWAWSGTGPYEGRPPHSALRSVGCLYDEQLHVVARAVPGVSSVSDLGGRRVSLDEPGSGTLLTARLVLAAHGLEESDLQPVYLKPRFAADRLGAEALDAYFVVAGQPASSVRRLTEQEDVRLLPVTEEPRRRLLGLNPFLRPDTIPAGTYPGLAAVETVSVSAQLLVSAEVAPDLVAHFTSALWSEATLRTLRQGHARGAALDPARALDCLTVPLHPGAVRAYVEGGTTVPSRLLPALD